jgi:DNA-binding CsgD family transcriptional regulator/tetratricopeptide (TPR) repeat protein
MYCYSIVQSHLIERSHQLGILADAVAGSEGKVVLVSGEAGHGKTSLVGAVLGDLDHRYHVLTSACEPLDIPAAFGPLFDLIDELPEDLRNDVKSGSGRMSVYAGMLDMIKNDRCVLVLEDLHWADEATLGLTRYLGRRVAATNSVLIVTYRSEELDVNPRLRLVVADLGPAAVRIDVPALTVEGVRHLVARSVVDPEKLYEATLGNPFFIEEVLRHPGLEVPPTVQNAVLANAEQLPDEALELLQLIALNPDGLSRDILEQLGDRDGVHTDLAFHRRLLVSFRDQVACRHELIRQSLVQALPPALKQRLHERLLEILERRAMDSPDVARLAYHGVGAHDAERAIRYSLRAGSDASKAGAHREAAFHYDNALEFDSLIDGPELSGVLLVAAQEHLFINNFERAVELSRRRIGLADSPHQEARARAWVAFFEARLNDYPAALTEAENAIAVLRGMQPSDELALALEVAASVRGIRGESEDSMALAEEALGMARSCGAVDIEVNTLITLGTTRWLHGNPEGRTLIEEAVRLGVENRAGEFSARAMNNLGVISLFDWDLDGARMWFERQTEYCSGNELEAWYMAGVVSGASIAVEAGRWDEADAGLERVWGQRTCYSSEIEVLTAAATLRIRRGDPGMADLAQSVFTRIETFPETVEEAFAAIMGMEGAWVGVLPEDQILDLYRRVVSRLGSDASFLRAQLAYWAYRLGWNPPDGEISGPPGLELQGHVEDAAQEWESRGYPVHAAITRATSERADLDSIFAALLAMGADGVARGLRRELLRRGVKRIPRGERTSTRENPAGLTNRELEVLRLLVAGSSNAGIARDLYISGKTAGHHVSSVLAKLGVSSRGQAAVVAVANGWAKSR